MQKANNTSNDSVVNSAEVARVSKSLDTTGRLCPDLMIDVCKEILTLYVGELIEIFATDPATKSDIPLWCKESGNVLLDSHFNMKTYRYYYLVERAI